jgi:predicted DNA-binding transcriptional regulator AlpA
MAKSTAKSEAPDELVPDPVAAQELGISLMGMWRYTNDPALDFPVAVKIRNRNFRSRRQLEEWKARLLSAAIKQRGQKTAAA